MNNPSKATGIVGAAIKLGILIHSSIDNLLTSVIISIVDANTTNIDNALLYNSMGSNITGTQNEEIINSSPFSTQQTIQFADRLWNVTFMPTPTFLAQHSTIIKWVGTIVSIIVCIILLSGCVLLLFMKRMNNLRQSRQRGVMQIGKLKENQNSLRILLQRITQQERRARSIIDAIPDFVLVLNGEGQIVHSNVTFDLTFGYGSADTGKGLFIGTVFPELPFKFYMNADNQVMKSNARKASDERIFVELTVRKLHSVSDNQSENLASSVGGENEEEAFIIIAHPASIDFTSKNVEFI